MFSTAFLLLVIAIVLSILVGLYYFDKLPDIKKLFLKKKNMVLNTGATGSQTYDCEEPNGIKINICPDSAITEDDMELRTKLFQKHLKKFHKSTDEHGNAKSVVPFQAIVFLTKKLNPIVSEDGTIIVSINKSEFGLIVGDRENIKPAEREEDILDKISISTAETAVVEKRGYAAKEGGIYSHVEEPAAEKEELIPAVSNELAYDEIENESVSSLMAEFDALEDEEEEDFSASDVEESDEGSLFDDFEEEEEVIKETKEAENVPVKKKFIDVDEDDFEEDVIVQTVDSGERTLPKNQAEAEVMLSSFLVFKSLDIIDDFAVIPGSGVDMESTIEKVERNDENVQAVFIKNLLALDGMGFLSDKSIVFGLYPMAEAMGKAVSSKPHIQRAVAEHLKNKQNSRDVSDIFSFIINNDDYLIGKASSPFSVMSLRVDRDGKECKVYGIKVSYNILNNYLQEVSDVVIKYPTKRVTFLDKSVDKFC